MAHGVVAFDLGHYTEAAQYWGRMGTAGLLWRPAKESAVPESLSSRRFAGGPIVYEMAGAARRCGRGNRSHAGH
jgi:hypothetical protein